MKNIVITGSSRGIGYGLAEAFLARGCQVMVSGRSANSVEQAVKGLSTQYGQQNVWGCACDVSDSTQVKKLWEQAIRAFGQVDIWINNAGVNHPMKSLWELSSQSLKAVVETNLLGAAYGSQIAIAGMIQQGHGHLYNMEGHGSDGQILSGMAGYGTSKSGVRYLTRALVQETKETPVKVSTLSPGMVVTQLVADQFKEDPAGLERAKTIFNLFGDQVQTVSPWLADRVLENDRTGATIAWFTWSKMLWRLLSATIQPRDVFALNNTPEAYVGEFS